jgi:two-component SAPR family response regulator
VTFKLGLECNNDDDNKSRFEVYTCNNPFGSIIKFKPNFLDLILVDINMSPYIDGFEFCEKILQLDVNVRLCFISAGEVNYAVIREIYPQY